MTPSDSDPTVDRRNFIAKSAIAGAAVVGAATANPNRSFAMESAHATATFNLKFAPHPGSFRLLAGNDVIDQIKFMHDQGFTAIEHNGLPKESIEVQTKIGKTLDELGMTMGVFVGYANFTEPTFAVKDETRIKEVLDAIKASVEVAKRVNAKWFTVVPGSIDQLNKETPRYGKALLAPGYQLANVIELLRRCCEILEPHELTMVLEPLNWHTDHGGTFLRDSDQAYAICKAVNSSSCKILFDIYHQQITEGNLIPNIDHCWDEIAYFQAGDNPGRKEPGTGEIHYANVFQHIYQRSKKEGREFVIGMEHGASRSGKEGEQAVIDAYKAVNPKTE